MTEYVLKNGKILDTVHGKLIHGKEVFVKNGMIEAVQDQGMSSILGETIDLNGQVLMPGLIDAHVHVTASQMDLADAHLADSEVSVQAGRFMEDMLMRGVTSIRDAGGADLGLAHAVEKGLIRGPRLFYCGHALSQTGGHGDFRKPMIGNDLCACGRSNSHISVIANGITEVRTAARDEIRKGATHIKIMASGGVASPTDRITNLQYSSEEIAAIVDEAKHAGIYVMAHAYSPEAIIHCIANGVRTIEHGNLLNDEAAKLMAKHDAYLVPTLVIYEALASLGPRLGFPKESLDKIASVREAGLNAIKIARKHGVKMGLGTDLLGVEGQTWQMREFMIRSAVESPAETIRSATLINAEILNHSGRLGVIAKGAYADLIVVDGDPLTNIQLLAGQGEALSLIMKNGVIYKNTLHA